MKTKIRKILVTSALPYANGPIHLGHLVEYIQTDIWVRYQKLHGHKIYYFCADDTHGTPIMLTAKKLNLTPEELIAKIYEEHYRDFTLFEIEFDNYYTTNSKENQHFSETFYLKAKEKGYIYKKKVEQLYCPHDKMFLPDRYVKGICPKCGAQEQYGDSCEKCGTSYRPIDIIEPKCAICGTTPIKKEEDHIFFKLSAFSSWLKEWLGTHTEESIRNKMLEWIENGLKDWDISRDEPYFGFPIPDEKNKYFYVWLDAPIGYISSSYHYFKKNKLETLFDEFWSKEKEDKTEVYHFIGKDIIYFHTLFWPAILDSADFRTPNKVFVHGFLTINGEKMSKSRGTFVKAQSYLKHLDPQALRYYYASRLSNSIDDIDLTIDDFIFKYNSDVVGNFANIFSRSAKLLETLNNQLSKKVSKEGLILIQTILSKKKAILQHYEERNFHKVVKIIVELANEINRYISEKEPWNLIKKNQEEARQILTDVLHAGWLLNIYLKPILPSFCKGIENYLNIPFEYPKDFSILSDNINTQRFLPENHKVNHYKHLASRITKEMVEKMFQEEQQTEEKHYTEQKVSYITIEDFSKIELKVGIILDAKEVKGSDKLLNLILDVGEMKPRNVFAGIKKSYKPEELIGKKVIAVTNLQPRKMKFGISEAMILATGNENNLSLITIDKDVETGSFVK